MLVTFKTSAYADITMFGDAAETLLKLMGQSGNVPGAIMAEDVPAALDTLRSSLQASAELDEESAAADAGDGSDDDESSRVALSTRAVPLIELLEAAIAAGENVMWES